MHQVSESDLRHHISFVLKQVSKTTLRNLNGSSQARTAAIDAITARLMERMAEWEIMVPEPGPGPRSPPNWKGES